MTHRLPLTRDTCLVDGRSPRGERMTPFWSGLRWDEPVYVDPGPSPAGNPGSYLKVRHRGPEVEWETPDPEDYTVHRIYPRWMVGMRFRRTKRTVVRVTPERDTTSPTGWGWVVEVE